MFDAQVLGQLLLMQSVLGQLPTSDSIFKFICKGLRDLPGVSQVKHTQEPPTDTAPSKAHFDLSLETSKFGFLEFELAEPEIFIPYTDFIKNFCFMVSVVLEERYQRGQKEIYQQELENRVLERTAQLQESEARFRRLMENARDAIYRMSLPDGHYEYMSPAAELLFGHSPEQFLNNSTLLESLVHPSTLPDYRKQWFDLEQGTVSPYYEYQIINARTGEPHWMNQRNVLVRDADGKLVAVEGIITDVSNQKKAERERLELERQIQHAQKLESLGVLAGGIAHDFNNILMAILGYNDLAIQDMSPSAPSRQYLDEVKKGCLRAAELVSEMLAYAGKGRYVVQPIDLNEFVSEMAHLLKVSASKKVRLQYEFGNNLPRIDGDPSQIRQIIMNLITNASDAIGDSVGTIDISTGTMRITPEWADQAYMEHEPTDDEYVYLAVVDNGCGMDQEVQKKMFEPFFTTKFSGRGLGMSAVLGIINSHKGGIRVSSEVGKGTEFTVVFPPSIKSSSQKDNEKDVQKPTTLNEKLSGTVLLVDDEKSVRDLGEEILKRLGFNVLTAVDGQEALEVFQSHQKEIGVVILDLSMPNMDGNECFQELRKLNNKLRVIISSGYDQKSVTQKLFEQGLAGFIQKPYQLKNLKTKLIEVLK